MDGRPGPRLRERSADPSGSKVLAAEVLGEELTPQPSAAQQRLRGDDEAGPAGSGQDAADGGKQGTVGGLELGASGLAAKHGELVAEHHDLEVLGGLAVGQQHEQLDRAAQRQVAKSWQHRVTSAVGSRGATAATRASMELTQRKGPI